MICIILKFITLWICSGAIFNLVVEGLPDPDKAISRVQWRIIRFDLMMGPIAWIWFGALGVRRIYENLKGK